jgi:hypothetical protein
MIFSSMLHLFFIFFGKRFEVLTVVIIHNAVWVRTPCSLVIVLEEHIVIVFAGSRKMEAACSDGNLGTRQLDYTVP